MIAVNRIGLPDPYDLFLQPGHIHLCGEIILRSQGHRRVVDVDRTGTVFLLYISAVQIRCVVCILNINGIGVYIHEEIASDKTVSSVLVRTVPVNIKIDKRRGHRIHLNIVCLRINQFARDRSAVICRDRHRDVAGFRK